MLNPNFVAHVYERLYLWELYQVFRDVEEPHKQQQILPFDTRKGQVATNNRASGVDGSLTDTEFMIRLNSQPLPAKVQLNGGNIKEAAGKLLDNRFEKQLKAANANKQKAEASKKHQY
ncbi:hypothetical protein SI65_00703 [Aspergillus cristatus]|uniref:Uncharacterized protein n=1 Tax=Aspergillus cristatus TaxID=573508 RepID=A0A1E3BQ61_ASPCR|nr:hypothetical protein SI65_00703 [Aspergillus cristatus]